MTTFKPSREAGKRAQFVKEHGRDPKREATAFNRTLAARAGKSKAVPAASKKRNSNGESDTRLPWRAYLIALTLATSAAPASAEEVLTSIPGEVQQASGSAKDIAGRAATCMSQVLSPGTIDADLFINKDTDGGIIVARSAMEYEQRLISWKVRSVFTFEARDGRFRIDQTNLELFGTYTNSWGPIRKGFGSVWKGAAAAFNTSAEKVSNCVIAGPSSKEW